MGHSLYPAKDGVNARTQKGKQKLFCAVTAFGTRGIIIVNVQCFTLYCYIVLAGDSRERSNKTNISQNHKIASRSGSK